MIKKILDWILGKNEQPAEPVAPYKVEVVPVAAGDQPVVIPVAEPVTDASSAEVAVVTTPVTVKAKYKRADLTKMSKKELLDLAAKHGLEVKARSTKEELVKILVKV
jgi:glutamate racemase